MANSHLHIIYPIDQTTDFLEEIIDHLYAETKSDIKLYRLETVMDHLNFIDDAENIFPDNCTIMFMGHGMSNALSGSVIGKESYGPFISENQLSVFKNKKVILLSCRSSQYLYKYGRECSLKAGLGFPNLITDPYEILYPDEPDRVNGILQPDIDAFKRILINTVKFSIEEYINDELSFYQLYKRIKLRSQRELMKFYNGNPKSGKLPLGKMIYDFNDGMFLLEN